jgi:hypothetical protein
MTEEATTGVGDRPLSAAARRLLDHLDARAATLGPGAIRARVRAAGTELETLFSGVSETRARQGAAGGAWSVAEVADHVAQTMIRAAEELRHLLAGRRPPEPAVYDGLLSGAAVWVSWAEIQDGVRAANREVDAVLATATAAADLPRPAPTVRTVLVVPGTAGAGPERFTAELGWPAYALVQRLHLIEHRNQVRQILDGSPGT